MLRKVKIITCSQIEYKSGNVYFAINARSFSLSPSHFLAFRLTIFNFYKINESMKIMMIHIWCVCVVLSVFYLYIMYKIYFQRFTSHGYVTRCAYSPYRNHNCSFIYTSNGERERYIQISFVEIAVNNKWIILTLCVETCLGKN